jgi:hypothetical protein
MRQQEDKLMAVKKGPEDFKTITKQMSCIDGALGFKLDQLLLLKRDWSSIAGSVVAANVDILTIRDNGVLVLSATSSVWMHEINGLRFQLLSKLKNSFPDFKINNIIVKMTESKCDRKLSSQEDFGLSSTRELTVAEGEHIEDCVKNVEDKDLQNLLRRIFIKSTRVRH